MTGRPVVLQVTTNGTGMGHLSRQVAIGSALSAAGADPVLVSLSTAVAHVLAAGTAATGGPPAPRGEYVPSYHRNWMPVPAWHAYLRDRVLALARETGAAAVGFDGVSPYLGLLRARAALPGVPFVWFRRGMWRPGTNTAALRAAPFFDAVVEPGDLAAAADRGATARRTDAVRVAPVTGMGRVPLLDRAAALSALGLPTDRPAVLVNLGGWAHRPTRGGDWWSSAAGAVVSQLLAGTDWQVALVRTPILLEEVRAAQTDRLSVVAAYPLSAHLHAFEAAVAEAGYNGFHEVLLAGLPTLFVPKSTRTDDQSARAAWAASAGVALHADAPPAVAVALSRLLDPARREDLRTVCAELPRDNGADAAAAVVLGAVRPGFRHRAGFAERRRVALVGAKTRVARTIGPAGTDLLRRLRGRESAFGGGPARPVAADPLVVDDLAGVDLLASRPVEHVLPGTSPAYLGARERIARTAYRVPPGWRAPQLGR